MSLIIECDNLIKIHKQGNLEVVALQGLNFSMDRGEFISIVGKSGGVGPISGPMPTCASTSPNAAITTSRSFPSCDSVPCAVAIVRPDRIDVASMRPTVPP